MDIDKYSVENLSQFSNEKLEYRLLHSTPKVYKTKERTKILAMPKQKEHHGQDFFQHNEFRGLFLADHQEALGHKATKYVNAINTNTVSKFNEVGSYVDSMNKRKTQENFYKAQRIKESKIMGSYSNRFGTK